MTLSIQYHAMPDEYIVLLSKIIADDNLWISEYCEDSPRFRIVDRVDGSLSVRSRRAIMFTPAEPNLSGATMRQFAELNPDALVLEIGGLSENGLGESFLWSNTRDKDVVRRWREAAKQLKASLLSGAIAVNPDTGESAPMKWHRFTRKAQMAYADGVAMRPPAGTSVIRLPDV